MVRGSSEDAPRTLRYQSTCNRVSSTVDPETCTRDDSRRPTVPNGGDRPFIWRTTKDRFIDFCLSPEEEARLKVFHERIIASPWSSVKVDEVAECLLTQGDREKAVQIPLLQRIRSFWRGLEEAGRRLFRTVIPCYEDTMLTAECFGIGEEDFNSRIYFLLVHVWSLHCALQRAGLETLKIKLWDALWDFLTNILIKEGASHTQDAPPNDGISHGDLQVSEFKVPAVLREQQFTSLGFCVSLDEAFEDETAFPAGQLAHRLWVTVFEAKEKRRDCPELIALTTYTMRVRSFALKLPREALVAGAFRWPAWPPVKSSTSSQASDPQ
ncbi:Ubiquinol-cytochrome c chaperone, related [Eimeria brunetti]|uniref:Ubiquinol-cytochrome c chaperone, related n=1 Tax=Eimeria brunetti TaxID=51314 RepID=U6LUX6_9EIME|nr:Ubiquinol-cytochrome c chaperone, related [Eimeria brunetti]